MKRKIIFYLIISLVSIIAFLLAHDYSNSLRVINGFGGELSFLFIPFLVWCVRKNVEE